MPTYKIFTEERVNLGNYEYIGFSAEVQFTADEAEDAGLDLGEFGLRALDVLLGPHRRRAYAALPAESESFLIDHPALETHLA